jgi:hypothetical protein
VYINKVRQFKGEILMETVNVDKKFEDYDFYQMAGLDSTNSGILYDEDNPENYYHYKNGNLHCVDGPAEYRVDNGEICEGWYQHGKYHRNNGPAYTISSINQKSEEYWINGLLHRNDGPARIVTHFLNTENPVLVNEYYFQGIKAISKEEFESSMFRQKAMMQSII